jgi:hypothetical protein
MISAFGVDHGEFSKSAESEAAKAAKEFLSKPRKWKPIVPKKATGPGSLRGKMDPETSHWPAAANRDVTKGWKTNTTAGAGVVGGGVLMAKPKLAAPLGTAAKGVTNAAKPVGTAFKSGFKPVSTAFKTGFKKSDSDRSSGNPTAGRTAAAFYGNPIHGLVAGRKGRKMAAAGGELGSAVGGGFAGRYAGAGIGAGIGAMTRKPGAAREGARIGARLGAYGGSAGGLSAGVTSMNRHGLYKPQKKD